jgi:hypothetical protein
VAIHALLPAFFDLFEHPYGRNGFIKMAFNRRHAFIRADREDLRPGAATARAAAPMVSVIPGWCWD